MEFKVIKKETRSAAVWRINRNIMEFKGSFDAICRFLDLELIET